MGRFDWGPEGPPEAAYSRVTEPERFLPLIEWSLGLLSELEAKYDVVRDEGYGLDPDLERTPPTRPTVRLTPARDRAAPMAVAFIDYAHPGIYVRFGRYRTEPFPDCGCDACDEDAEGEFERFREMVEAVTAGQFREWFRLEPDGSGRVGREFWSAGLHGSGSSRVEPDSVTRFAGGKDHVLEWLPWIGRRRSGDRGYVRVTVQVQGVVIARRLRRGNLDSGSASPASKGSLAPTRLPRCARND